MPRRSSTNPECVTGLSVQFISPFLTLRVRLMGTIIVLRLVTAAQMSSVIFAPVSKVCHYVAFS
jgi:hypothetical protein